MKITLWSGETREIRAYDSLGGMPIETLEISSEESFRIAQELDKPEFIEWLRHVLLIRMFPCKSM